MAFVLLGFAILKPNQIATALQRTPLLTVEEMRAALEAAPAAGGLYAWWLIERGGVPGVPATPHPSASAGLLYVGVGPTSGSSRPLRKRFADHTKRNTGSSTFRLVLASFLFERADWRPYWTDRPMLARDDNDALSAWQAQNLRVQWIEVAEPWHFEADVIALLRPPLNREHNQAHPFYAEVGRARDAYRAAARANQSR